MKSSLEEYRAALMNKILVAVSQEDIQQLVGRAIKELEQEMTDSYTIAFFTEKCIRELELFNPMNIEARQWSNIKTAKVYFQRIKYKYQLNAQ